MTRPRLSMRLPLPISASRLIISRAAMDTNLTDVHLRVLGWMEEKSSPGSGWSSVLDGEVMSGLE